jgi:glycosyltransferase involved in cell wall biosynthesis
VTVYKGKTVAVVVPAYNEERLIDRVIETMPEWVDRIVVVDDCSQDGTADRVRTHESHMDGRLRLIRHNTNQGVGGAIATGYQWCRKNEMDVAVVMAGDAQMEPADLPALLDPVVSGEIDYAKGNRLFTGDAWNQIPKLRYLGNSMLSLLTKIASGYWHVADSQSGYTAVSARVLETIDWDRMYKRYGQPNDLLVRLNVHNFRVRDVPVTPVYNIGEDSGVRPLRMIPKLSWLLFKLFLHRMWQKYVIRDFHPLVFFYALAFLLLTVSLPLGGRVFYRWLILGEQIPAVNALAWMSSMITGLQSLFFAMWFDMEYNKELR